MDWRETIKVINEGYLKFVTIIVFFLNNGIELLNNIHILVGKMQHCIAFWEYVK